MGTGSYPFSARIGAAVLNVRTLVTPPPLLSCDGFAKNVDAEQPAAPALAVQTDLQSER
jgi:hypothetical protein